MQLVTLLFLRKEGQILLAVKKRGTGQGKWNGAGGKVQPNESIEAATIRECEEEIGVRPDALKKVAVISFEIPAQNFHNVAHVFITDTWTGDIVETEEMAPRWFALDAIPYDAMWSNDQIWLPRVLAGERIAARFVFNDDESVVETAITPLAD